LLVSSECLFEINPGEITSYLKYTIRALIFEMPITQPKLPYTFKKARHKAARGKRLFLKARRPWQRSKSKQITLGHHPNHA
jgi:hypothetical protein